MIVQEQASQANLADFVNNTRCAGLSGSMLVQCLYSLNMVDIINGITNYWNGPFDMGIPQRGEKRKQLGKFNLQFLKPSCWPVVAIVDGYLLPDTLSNLLETGEVNDVPLMFGVMHEEVDIAPLDIVFNMSKRQYQAFLMQR